MDTQKKEIKKKARRLGVFLMAHQLVFQIGTIVLMFTVLSALNLLKMSHLEAAVTLIASDLMQLAAGVFFLVFYLMNRKTIKQMPMGKKKCNPRFFGKCMAAVFGVNMMLSMGDHLLKNLTGFSLSVPMEGTTGINPAILFLTVAVFPAIVEELLYRGVLYRYLRGHGVQFAAIASSLIFGLAHMNFLQLIFATVLGLVCCYIYEATGKIRYSMLLHLLNNSIVVLFSALPLSSQTVVTVEMVLGVVSIVAAAVYLIRRGLKTDINPESGKSCLYFFTSIPMVIFTLACLGVCVYLSFG